MTTRHRLLAALASFFLAAGAATFCAIQTIVGSMTCETNLPSVGTYGSGGAREVDDTTVRCHYYDVSDRDFDFTIDYSSTVIAMVLAGLVALISLAQVIGILRERRAGAPRWRRVPSCAAAPS